jgi:hypothetical protein
VSGHRPPDGAWRSARQPPDAARKCATTDTPTAPRRARRRTQSDHGLLGRKPDDAAGPSFRTGLLLTIVLLILLAAIAVWSALFLPDSPVARLFGGGSEVAVEDPLDAPDAPFAITAPPAIGELATVDAPPAPSGDRTFASRSRRHGGDRRSPRG